MKYRITALAAIYITAIVAANVVIANFPPLIVGPLVILAGAPFAGLVLAVRDDLHDAGGLRLVAALILAGALISAATSPLALAVASGVAFLLSELLDMFVYQRLRASGRNRALVVSNVLGAAVDTAVFLLIAGLFAFGTFAGQLLVKGLIVSLFYLAVRAGVRRVRVGLAA